jgi:hypothetical protein
MLEPEPTVNITHEENPHPCNTTRLSGRDMNRSAFRRLAGTLEQESKVLSNLASNAMMRGYSQYNTRCK